MLLAVAALVTIGTAEALASNAQLAELPGRGRPALSGGGAVLTLVGAALSIAVYVALGILLARSGAPESAAIPIGLGVGAVSGLVGGTIRAYLVSDYVGGVLAGYGLGQLLVVTLAVFVALSVLTSLAAGAALTWLSFRAARRRPTPRPRS
jgi:hypothetical protein